MLVLNANSKGQNLLINDFYRPTDYLEIVKFMKYNTVQKSLCILLRE